MHAFLYSIVAASTPTTSKTPAKTTGGSYEILIFIALIALVYIFFIRPRSQRARQAQQQQKQFQIGDDVVSIGGITGRVVGLDADEVEVEVAPGVRLTFLRRAVNSRNPAPATPTRGAGAGSGAPSLFGRRRANPPAQPQQPVAEDDWDDSEFEEDQEPEPVAGEVDGTAGTGVIDVDGDLQGSEADEEEEGLAGGTGTSTNGINRAGGSRRRRNRRSGRGGGSGSSTGSR